MPSRKGLRFGYIRQQAIKLCFDNLVAFAGAFLQSSPVKYSNVTAPVMNKPSLLQLAGGLRDALATHAKHAGNQLMGHGQCIRR